MDYVPERIIKSDNLLNKIMLGFNIAVPVVYGSINFISNYLAIEVGVLPAWVKWTSRGSNISAVFFQIISGIFLFYALFKIQQFITKEDISLVDLKKMAIHSVAFGLYMVAAATQQIFWVINYSNPNDKTFKNDLIVDIVCNSA